MTYNGTAGRPQLERVCWQRDRQHQAGRVAGANRYPSETPLHWDTGNDNPIGWFNTDYLEDRHNGQVNMNSATATQVHERARRSAPARSARNTPVHTSGVPGPPPQGGPGATGDYIA